MPLDSFSVPSRVDLILVCVLLGILIGVSFGAWRSR